MPKGKILSIPLELQQKKAHEFYLKRLSLGLDASSEKDWEKAREYFVNHPEKIWIWRGKKNLYLLPPIIYLFLVLFLPFPNIYLQKFTPFILQSLAAGISLIIGFSNRNASISERARSKAAELLKSIKEEDEPKRQQCLREQIMRFKHRFQLNQAALFIAWISLFMGLIIGFIVSYVEGSDSILTKLFVLIIGLLSYSFLITLWDIALGSTHIPLL